MAVDLITQQALAAAIARNPTPMAAVIQAYLSDLGSVAPDEFPGLPPVVYDQSFGATDSNGFVAELAFIPKNTGARQVWLNTAAGLSTYNGLSPFPGFQMNGTGANFQIGATGPGAANAAFGPMVDLVTALNTLPIWRGTAIAGIPNQVFCAEGQTFPLNGPFVYGQWGGGSANGMACYQSYDPADPLNLARHGRAGTAGHGARPIWYLGASTSAGAPKWPSNTRGDAFDYGGWVFRGLEFDNPTNYAQGLAFTRCQHNMLFENMVFNNVSVVLQDDNMVAGFWPAKSNLLRFCASYGQFDFNAGHAGGMFSDTTYLRAEFCIWYHNGWSIQLNDRDLPSTAGGPDIFKHSAYVDSHRAGFFTGVGNVFIDPSAAGLSLRGDHLVHHNVLIDCPTPEFKSGGSGSDAESPSGVLQQSYCQLVIGGADISKNLPRMQGFKCSDGKLGSFHSHNLYANNPGYGNVNNQWLEVTNNILAQITHVDLEGNRAFAFAPPAKRLILSAGSPDPTVASVASINMTDNDNIMSPTSPMTNAQIYAAIGYSSKAAMVAAMIADPTQPWAYRLLAAAAAGFGFDFNYTLTSGGVLASGDALAPALSQG